MYPGFRTLAESINPVLINKIALYVGFLTRKSGDKGIAKDKVRKILCDAQYIAWAVIGAHSVKHISLVSSAIRLNDQ